VDVVGSVPSASSLRAPWAPVAAPLPLPAVVAHADWASLLSGRWVARATLRADGSYHARAPEPAGPGGDLLARLLDEARGGTVLLGVDLPIGLPEPFARLAGVDDFAAWLRAGPPESWFAAASTPEEIALTRPFYPRARGDARRAHLVERLGVSGYGDLLRRCDVLTRATCMFWTMGPQQCGKAALAGWRELARPVALDPGAGLWPFEGSLPELLATRRLVLAETYPAECYRQVLEIAGRFSKQRREDRLALAGQIAARAASVGLALGPLGEAVGRGFYDADGADNGFDATVGLLAIVAVLRGRGREGVPDEAGPRLREGWMLGLTTSSPRCAFSASATAR
jgi:hypothetical protein